MGNCHERNELDGCSTISEADFEFIKPIGRGAFGTVWDSRHKKTNVPLALKVFTKASITTQDALNSILKERAILSILSHPFIINMKLAFHSTRKLFLGLDLKLGGDLRFHITKKKFNEPEIKFVLCCVIQALEFVHSCNFIHKDVKPENIVLDNSGYAFLTDFGTCELIKTQNGTETSGTPGYMAPEVICRQNHSFVSDFFSLGIILYEVIMGNRPYMGKNRQEIRQSILNAQVSIHKESIPEGWTEESVDICNGLLKRKPSSRLGAGGVQEILQHPWFADFDLEKLKKFELKAPFVPEKENNYDKSHVNCNVKRRVNKLKIENKSFVGYFFRPKLMSC